MKKGSFIGLVPIIVFLVLYFAVGIGTGRFDKDLPLMIGVFIACAVSLFITSPVAEKKTFTEKAVIFCKGGGDDTLILMVIIYMLAGAFYSVAGEMHATDTVKQIGFAILPPNMILPAIFIIGCILSFAMGTSMGTVSALIPIAAKVAIETNTPMPIVCGIVVGSAMFGDNLSFISDTTIAATTTQGCEMRSKFQQNILMCIPAVVITLIATALIPIKIPEGMTYTLEGVQWLNLLPYVLIIALSLMGMHVLNAMTISIIVGIIIGIIHGDFGLLATLDAEGNVIKDGALTLVHTGMTWMQDMAVIAIFIGGLVAMMNYLGGIDWLLYTLSKSAKSKKGAELAISGLSFIMDIATTNNTVSIIACGPIAKEISEKYDIAPERTASLLDLFTSVGNGISPHAGQILTATALGSAAITEAVASGQIAEGAMSVSTIQVIPWCWYPILMGISALIFVILGIAAPVKRKTAA